MILEIKDIECLLGGTKILRSCSLDVAEREIVSVLGRNGAGKSSILKSIIGLYPIHKGDLIFRDRNISSCTPRERVLSGIAYSPEDSKLFSGLTVEENIMLGQWISNKEDDVDKFSIDKACQIFPAISKLLKRKAGNLSGGEKKMVSISRALALNPSLVLFDESYEGLSPLVVNAFSDAMKSIKNKLGVSIILSESNLHNASQIAERVYIIDRGEIVFDGTPVQIAEDDNLLKIVGR